MEFLKVFGAKLGLFERLDSVVFSTLLFIKTVLAKNKAPLAERSVERFSVTANRGLLCRKPRCA
ncbi:hypothetical protein BVH65_16405 [Vibrio cholerae]|nr:hypothetical protein [Vibrio cholerae]MBO1371403.1 hypothetical protein [Vibrio cholerae]MBO1374868.1 hypothetical protein [Vibrio cholerae]MBO1378856.1 hypothetical protein [Vibrio cholerae]MBO1408664.1 hypothetical protein [Vibrio cholerae]